MPVTIKELLKRGVKEIIERKHLEKALKSGKKLRVKHGVDPTTPELHLGYAVVYEKLRQFQELGHKIVFLIGDFTARFGDPTQQKKTRKLRSRKEVQKIAKNYISQLEKILDIKKLEIRYNGEWYDKMSAEELLQLMSHFTIQRMLERDMFQERMKKHQEIALHEPVYPTLQAYDSVMLKSDLTVIGTDQKFNELQARMLQRKMGQDPQDLVIMPLLIGTDEKRKMSQNLGNYIGINESAHEQYGKIMSIPDNIIIHYFELLTHIPDQEIREMKMDLQESRINPRDLKARLAREIVTIYHSRKEAIEAEKEFERIFKEKKKPSKVKSYKLKVKSWKLPDLLLKLKLVSSKSEARRLITQGGVKTDDKVIKDWKKKIQVKKDTIIQVGKRKFAKIK